MVQVDRFIYPLGMYTKNTLFNHGEKLFKLLGKYSASTHVDFRGLLLIATVVCGLSHLCFVYRKISKISPGSYIFQRPLLRSLFLEGLLYGGKFAFQNRFG